MPAKKKAEPEVTLEDRMTQLEEVLLQLEQENLGLEDSFDLYKKGMELVKQCNQSIDRVEKKLLIIQEEEE